jgi:hypothetical protein
MVAWMVVLQLGTSIAHSRRQQDGKPAGRRMQWAGS